MTVKKTGLAGGSLQARSDDQLNGSISSEINASAATTQVPNGQAAITIVIGGAPVAKGRARATRRGFVYTPTATRKYEAHGRLAAQLAMNGRPPIAVPVCAEITMEGRLDHSTQPSRGDKNVVRISSRP